LYTRFSFHTGAGIGKQFSDLKTLGGKLLWLAALPLGTALWLRDRLTWK
jgi:hypothetical protein